jgi:N6-L-threonylcarbamoyladenine synthase
VALQPRRLERSISPSFFEGNVLGIETSCDETSAAVVFGHKVLSNVIASQIEMHQKWGGVVPEAAARAHVEALLPVVQEALEVAGVKIGEIAGVAVTNRPGLVGALSVGVTAAKAIALANRIPLLGIHHLEGHLSSLYASEEPVTFPFVALIASGGHTELVRVNDVGEYSILGETIDDAAGEAFDKGARAMGLPYPGGRAIQEAAHTGNPHAYRLPQSQLGGSLNFSFSGLKTAVLRLVDSHGKDLSVPDAAASLQHSIVNVLVQKSLAACEVGAVTAFALVGGVAANRRLREKLQEACERFGIRFIVPPFELCTDNAAMIGLAGSARFARNERSGFDLGVFPNESIETLRGGVAHPA